MTTGLQTPSSSTQASGFAKLSLGVCLAAVICTAVGIIAAIFSLQGIGALHALIKLFLGVDDSMVFSTKYAEDGYILGLIIDTIVVFILTVLGVWFGHKARRHWKVAGQPQEKNLVVASLAIAYIWFFLFMIPLVVMIVFLIIVVAIIAFLPGRWN